LSVEAQFIAYERRFAAAFESLNRRWIEELFEIEEEDLAILRHPEEYVLAKGGPIFFALHEGEAVGCVAMTPICHGQIELSKMAVDPSHQGRGLGRGLLEVAVDWARSGGATLISLQSSSRLPGALRVYESAGFQITHRGPHPDYARTDIVMELKLEDD